LAVKILLVSCLMVSLACLLLLLLLVLALAPVARVAPGSGLDFDVLELVGSGDARVNERRYTARDGAELFYSEIGSGTGTIVVLLHGSGSEGRYLLPLASKLVAQAGATVIVPDLRGHGRSALGRSGDIAYLGQLEHDLEDLNSYLRTRNPQSNIVLGGHSSGGGLAIRYGGSAAAGFDGFLLLAPYLGHQAPTVRTDSGGWVQVSVRRYIALGLLNTLGITLFNDTPVLFFRRPPELADALQVESYSYRLNESLTPQPYGDALAGNGKPMLVLVGEQDEAFFADQFKPVLDTHAPHARLYVLPGVRHLNLPGVQASADIISSWLLDTF
jgi:pimeloyl-ACP methyl ester carboxylesterase